MSFWKSLKKPFFVMAPMADVTDVAFRSLVAKRGKPDVFWTEFVSADGLYHTREIAKMRDANPTSLGSSEGHGNPLMRDLVIGEGQRPIVAQIFSNKPEMIAYAVKLVAELGFDGVDINMGCPDRSVEKQGAGAALVKNPKLAVELIRAAQEASSLPVSVKTRVGYHKESLDEWLTALLEAAPAAITLHLRTRKEMSLVPADWDLMKKAVEIRDRVNPNVLLIGNGDVETIEQGRRLAGETGCDGIMIGRGMFGNPWVFEGLTRLNLENSDLRFNLVSSSEHGLDEKLEALIELAHGFEQISPPKSFAILKKHIKAFVTGFDGASNLRARLMQAESADEIEKIVLLTKI
ncbi:MAG: tRNA-dihydrouridine synthase [Candidatus Pacebacteria bacterium]|nr:tRNA-dihydrouridine synthase [Candidatus Paceibacterota bacterium]